MELVIAEKPLIMIQPNSNKKGGTLCEVIFKNLQEREVFETVTSHNV